MRRISRQCMSTALQKNCHRVGNNCCKKGKDDRHSDDPLPGFPVMLPPFTSPLSANDVSFGATTILTLRSP
jgi:hypothetical protein